MTDVDGLGADQGRTALSVALSGARRDGDRVLLLHCGELPGAGPNAERAILDVRERVGAAHRTWAADADRLCGALMHDDFDHIAMWPRAHLGLDFALACIDEACVRVRDHGAVWLAARKQKGAERLMAALAGRVGDVEVIERARGQRCVVARARPDRDRVGAHARLAQAYTVQDSRLGDARLDSRPGVFSRKALDAGTCALIDVCAARVELRPGARALDAGCGLGPLLIWGAERYATSRWWGVESNTRAADLAARNVAQRGVQARVNVDCADALRWLDGRALARQPGFDLVLTNPPTHAPKDEQRAWITCALAQLEPGGRALIVVSREDQALAACRGFAGRVEVHTSGAYKIVEARRSR